MTDNTRDVWIFTAMIAIAAAVLVGLVSCAAARPSVEGGAPKRSAISQDLRKPVSGIMTIRQGNQAAVMRSNPAVAHSIRGRFVVSGDTLVVTFSSLDKDVQKEVGGSMRYVKLADGVYSRTEESTDGRIIETWVLKGATATRIVTGRAPDGNFVVDETWTAVIEEARL